MTTIARLNDLKPGMSARICSIDGDDSISLRLMEMGLTAGETIEAIAISPFGDPVEYSIRGYRLVLRAVEAARVQVSAVERDERV